MVLAFTLLATGISDARAPKLRNVRAGMSPAKVIDVRGRVHPARRSWRVRVQERVAVKRHGKTRTGWRKRAHSKGLGKRGRFHLTYTAAADTVVVRVVVLSAHGKRLARGKAITVGLPTGPPPPPTPGSTLEAGHTLAPGDKLVSPNQQYTLVMQPEDGNLVLYGPGGAVWSSGAGGAGSRAEMQGDGNFVVYKDSEAKWNAGTNGFDGAALALQDDGNLVIYQLGHAIWARTAGYLGDTLISGAQLSPGAYLKSADKRYILVMQPSDGNLALYGPEGALWGFGTDGHPGAGAAMQGDGNFVVISGSTPVKWTGTEGHPGAIIRLQNDNNLVVYDGPTALWSRNDGLIAGSGPVNIPNADIAAHAEQRPDGANEDECLIFVSNMIAEAGGPKWYFGNDPDKYQEQWAARAKEIGSIEQARRGDIIQWGGGAGGNLLHTAIVTAPGSDPSVIDSNFASHHAVGRGSFSSRNGQGNHYRIWRVGKV